jgi:hypothetical protein
MMVWPDDLRPLERKDGIYAALACVLLLGLIVLMLGCARPKSAPLPTIPQDGHDYRVPAWNVGGRLIVGCGAGGKACGG